MGIVYVYNLIETILYICIILLVNLISLVALGWAEHRTSVWCDVTDISRGGVGGRRVLQRGWL